MSNASQSQDNRVQSLPSTIRASSNKAHRTLGHRARFHRVTGGGDRVKRILTLAAALICGGQLAASAPAAPTTMAGAIGDVARPAASNRPIV